MDQQRFWWFHIQLYNLGIFTYILWVWHLSVYMLLQEHSEKLDNPRGKHGFPGELFYYGIIFSIYLHNEKFMNLIIINTTKFLFQWSQVSGEVLYLVSSSIKRWCTAFTCKVRNLWLIITNDTKFFLSVKPNVQRSILPKPSNLTSRPWGNRVSDGFVIM